MLDAHRWTQRYAPLLDDVRAAMDAAMVQTEDADLVGELAIASAPLWFRVSQVSEYRARVEAALGYLHARPGHDGLAAGRLDLALYNALWHTGGTMADMTQACERALASALAFESEPLEFQARWGFAALSITCGDYTSALQHARRLHVFAIRSGSDATRNLSQRMLALAHHFCGAFAEARVHADAAMEVDGLTRRNHANAFQPHASTTAMGLLARTQWIQGDARLAMATASRCAEEALALDHAMSCVALYWICPVAIWGGERATARAWVDTMLRETQSRAFAYWHEWAQCFDDALAVDEVGDRAAHIEAVARRIPTLDLARGEMLATCAPEWVTDGLLARAMQGQGQWNAAEVLRAAGFLRERQGHETEAAQLYRRSVGVARAQGATAWELRAARSMKQLRDTLDRRDRAAA